MKIGCLQMDTVVPLGDVFEVVRVRTDHAMEFDRYVYDCLPPFANHPQIFGEQTILDAEDQPVGAGC